MMSFPRIDRRQITDFSKVSQVSVVGFKLRPFTLLRDSEQNKLASSASSGMHYASRIKELFCIYNVRVQRSLCSNSSVTEAVAAHCPRGIVAASDIYATSSAATYPDNAKSVVL